MTTPVRLIAYALGLGALIGAALSVGSLVGPTAAAPPAHNDAHRSAMTNDHADGEFTVTAGHGLPGHTHS